MTKSRSENTAVNSWRTYGVSNQYLSTHLTLYALSLFLSLSFSLSLSRPLQPLSQVRVTPGKRLQRRRYPMELREKFHLHVRPSVHQSFPPSAYLTRFLFRSPIPQSRFVPIPSLLLFRFTFHPTKAAANSCQMRTRISIRGSVRLSAGHSSVSPSIQNHKRRLSPC